MKSPVRWAILTGDYPPDEGGVSDYTRQVARDLALAGEEVHVWCPASRTGAPVDPGVRVHPLPGRFGIRALRVLGGELDRLESPRRILVQYVPHGFGWKAMNVAFCLWLWSRRREDLWVMFHEVAFPVDRAQSARHNLLGRTNQFMARLVIGAARGIYVSIPAWEPLIRRLGRVRGPVRWLPVPSNLASTPSAERVRALRERYGEWRIVTHFGTYGALVGPLVAEVLPTILRGDPNRLGLLLGRGGETFRDELAVLHPDLANRLIATGSLSAEEVANHLAASDVVLQPYPDGASSRRGSLMASLAVGCAVVTTEGDLSEPIWRESGAVALVPSGAADEFVREVEDLLDRKERRESLRRRAQELYRTRFALAHTIRTLRQDAHGSLPLDGAVPTPANSEFGRAPRRER